MLKEVTIDNKRSEYRFLIAVGIENVLSGGSKGIPHPITTLRNINDGLSASDVAIHALFLKKSEKGVDQ
jgi:hypothetical protein